jgi:hypothetical protein
LKALVHKVQSVKAIIAKGYDFNPEKKKCLILEAPLFNSIIDFKAFVSNIM